MFVTPTSNLFEHRIFPTLLFNLWFFLVSYCRKSVIAPPAQQINHFRIICWQRIVIRLFYVPNWFLWPSLVELSEVRCTGGILTSA